jgi:hypothetical protein
MSWIPPLTLGAAIVLATTACTQLPWLNSNSTPHPSTTQQQPAPTPTHSPPPATASVAPPKSAKPTAGFEPHRLIGLNHDEAAAVAGKPTDTRDEPPASVWRYRVEECFIDVYFYMDMATQQFRALAYEVKPSKATAEIRKTCAEMARAVSTKK